MACIQDYFDKTILMEKYEQKLFITIYVYNILI